MDGVIIVLALMCIITTLLVELVNKDSRRETLTELVSKKSNRRGSNGYKRNSKGSRGRSDGSPTIENIFEAPAKCSLKDSSRSGYIPATKYQVDNKSNGGYIGYSGGGSGTSDDGGSGASGDSGAGGGHGGGAGGGDGGGGGGGDGGGI